MLGSLTAILLAGTLNYVGKRFPRLTGEGHLQPGGHDELLREEEDQGGQADVTTIAAAVVTAVTLYLIGALTQRLFSFPAPVAMLIIAVLLKLARAVSPSLQQGAFQVYKFFSTAVTYPLLFAIGDALGQAGRSLHAALSHYHRLDGGDDHRNGVCGRGLAEDVSDRHRHRHCLPQWAGRHRRYRHSHRGQSDAAHALCADRHAHRRGDYRDGGTDRLDAIGLALAAQRKLHASWQASAKSAHAFSLKTDRCRPKNFPSEIALLDGVDRLRSGQ